MLSVKTFTRIFSLALVFAMVTAAHASDSNNEESVFGYAYIGGPTSVSCGATGYYNGYFVGDDPFPSYHWVVTFSTGGGAAGSGPFMPVIFPNASGVASIQLTVYYQDPQWGFSVTGASWSTQYGGVAPAKPGAISGPTSECTANATRAYSISAVSGATSYTWSVPSPFKIVHPSSGSLVSSYTGSQTSVNVRFPSSGSATGSISVYATGGSTSCPANSASQTKSISFGPKSYSISGVSSARAWRIYTWSITTAGTSNYYWSYPSGWFPLGGNTSSEVNLEVGKVGGYVSVSYSSCGGTTSSNKYVTVTGGDLEIPRDANELPELEKVEIYPNPAHGVVNVSATADIQSIQVMTLTGQIVLNAPVAEGRQAKVDVSSLQAGTYFLVTTGKERQHVHQLVIE